MSTTKTSKKQLNDGPRAGKKRFLERLAETQDAEEEIKQFQLEEDEISSTPLYDAGDGVPVNSVL